MTTSRMTAFFNLTLAMMIVGSSVVFGKVITASFPVFLASGLRFAIASVLLLPILLIYEKNLFEISKKEIWSLLFMAICGQVIFTFFVLLGLRYTSAIEAGLITSTSPAVMAGVTWLFWGERPGKIQVLALALVVAGIVSVNMVWEGGAGIQAGHLKGNLFMLAAVVGEAFFLLMRKRIPLSISNLALTGYLCFLGLFLFLPLSVYQALSFDFSGVTGGAWLAIFYFGAVFTVLAYFFWFQGVARVSGSIAGVFTAVMPASAVVFSCLFLKESLTLAHVFGGILILAAIFLTAADS